MKYFLSFVSILAMTTFFCFPNESKAMILEDTVIKGKIKSYDKDNVVIKSAAGHTYTVPRKNLPKNFNFESKKEVTVPLKVKKQDLRIGNLPYEIPDIGKFNKNKLKKLVWAYQIFMVTTEKMQIKEGMYKSSAVENRQSSEQVFTWNKFLSYVFGEAVAEGESAEPTFNCFHSGWPSIRSGSSANASCRNPASSQVKTAMAAEGMGGGAFTYHNCGADGVFRCNPILFGPSIATHAGSSLGPNSQRVPGSLTRVRPVPASEADHGICVHADGESQIIERCTEASRSNLDQIVARITASPQNFERFATAVGAYCRASARATNAACLALRDRLAALRLSGKGNRTQYASCEIVPQEGPEGERRFGLFGAEAGNGSGGSSCPGSMCFVRANCLPNAPAASEGGASSAPATPVPVTAVCSCERLGGAASLAAANAEKIRDCVNDESITVLNPASDREEDNPFSPNGATH